MSEELLAPTSQLPARISGLPRPGERLCDLKASPWLEVPQRRTTEGADGPGMDNIESPALVYTAQEVADLLKINRDSVRLATVTGDLPHRQLGETTRSIRYTQADIDAFLLPAAVKARQRSCACRRPASGHRSLPARSKNRHSSEPPPRGLVIVARELRAAGAPVASLAVLRPASLQLGCDP